jgi:hypothetical protein
MEEKKEYKSNFRVINLSSYQTPVVKEEYNKDYIKFGDNNDYFEKLVDNYLSSATNSRCISGISDMIYGRGLESLNSEQFPQDYVLFKKLIKYDDVKRLIKDYYMLGQAALQLTYNKQKTEILKVSHFPMYTLRASKAVNGVIKDLEISS